jgi:hypothetical protein
MVQLKTGRFGVFAVSSLAVGLSWYVIQLIIDSARLIGGMQGTGGRAEMSAKGLDFWIKGFPLELAWMVFPVAALVIIVGIVLQMKERTEGDKLTLSFLALFLLYYVQYHFHSYYLLPMAPFLAIAFSRACTGVFPERWRSITLRAVATTMVIVSMLFGTVVMMAGHKWGRWSPLTVGNQSGIIKGAPRLFVDPPVTQFLGPFVGLIDPSLKPKSLDMNLFLQMSHDDVNSLILTSGPDKDYPFQIPAVHVYRDTRYRPVLFGYAIGQWHDVPQNTYMFANAAWTAEKVGRLWRFGDVTDSVATKWTLYDRKTLREIFLNSKI